jgi:hypothetical protein
MSLPDMVAAGRYAWVNPSITTKRFPVEGTGKKTFRAKLFDSLAATIPRKASWSR